MNGGHLTPVKGGRRGKEVNIKRTGEEGSPLKLGSGVQNVWQEDNLAGVGVRKGN